MKKQLALCGGKSLRTRPIGLWPVWDQREEKAVLMTLRSGRWGHAMRPDDRATAFEKAFAAYQGVKYAISVANGSVSLELCLRAVKIGPGDEVITPATTWVATNLAPVMVGADPVFVDVCPDTYCLDPDQIEPAITKKTRAIIVVHLGGYLCDMDRIMKIARKHRLIVIEDCAQAHGSVYKGKKVGAIGDFGSFSFEQSKLMTAGEGGMVTTNNDAWGNYVNSLAHARMKYGNDGQYFPEHGRAMAWNLRMTEFQAAILSEQLKRLDAHKKKRIANAEYLREKLLRIDGITPLKQSPDQNYFSYVFRYDASRFNDVRVARFRQALAAEGISCFSSASHQPPVYRSPAFFSPRNDFKKVRCPVAERAFEEEAVGLRANALLLGTKKDMNDIVSAIVKIRENIDELVAWKDGQ